MGFAGVVIAGAVIAEVNFADVNFADVFFAGGGLVCAMECGMGMGLDEEVLEGDGVWE